MELFFNWDRGTADDRMVEVLKQHNIDFHYDLQNLCAIIRGRKDPVRLDYEKVEGRRFRIMEKKYVLNREGHCVVELIPLIL